MIPAVIRYSKKSQTFKTLTFGRIVGEFPTLAEALADLMPGLERQRAIGFEGFKLAIVDSDGSETRIVMPGLDPK